jgi:tryptophanyl-tRNA synthetase
MKEENKKKKPILFTGITPTGTLTIGHYLGVVRHLVRLQEEYQIFFMIADLHALTTISERRLDYKERTQEIASLLYACGLREENCRIFVQSEIKEHVELSYLLSSYCAVGKLKNMIQYKEKSLEGENTSVSLLYYPILMAADILLYDADLVIVGKDQKQHLELTKYLVNKFNFENNRVLKIPEFSISSFGSKIMGFKNPLKKMSKSGDDYVAILDDLFSVRKKIMRAETDSEEKIYYDPKNKPGISNLLTIYSCFSNMQIDEVEKLFANHTYKSLKESLINLVGSKLSKIQDMFGMYKISIDNLIRENNDSVRKLAILNIERIKKEIKLWNTNE